MRRKPQLMKKTKLSPPDFKFVNKSILKSLLKIEHGLNLALPSPIENLHLSWLPSQYELFVKRDDLIHPIISGNKWRKLKWNIALLLQSDIKTLVSFGGAHSNHLYALAYVSNFLGLRFVAFVRGEELTVESNDTLKHLNDCGTEVYFVSRSAYRYKERDKEIATHLKNLKNYLLVPEGGYNLSALEGVGELVDEIENLEEFDYILVPAGTGTTAAGVIKRLFEKNSNASVVVFNVLKPDFIGENITRLIGTQNKLNFEIVSGYHFGGFGRYTSELKYFKEEFESQSKILIDMVYNAKLLYGLKDLLQKAYFPNGSRILWIHTGGVRY